MRQIFQIVALPFILCLACYYTPQDLHSSEADHALTTFSAKSSSDNSALITFPAGQLRSATKIHLHWTTAAADRHTSVTTPTLSLTLLEANGAWFQNAQVVSISSRQQSGHIEIDLHSAAWTGSDGPLDDQRLAAITALKVLCRGKTLQTVKLNISASNDELPVWAVQKVGHSLQKMGAGYGWTFRLFGPTIDKDVEVITDSGQVIPAFRSAHYYQGQRVGPSLYAIRLRPAEIETTQLRIQISDRDPQANVLWQATIPFASNDIQTSKQTEPTAAPKPSPWPQLISPAYHGWHSIMDQQGSRRVFGDLPPALAPMLRWQPQWTTYSGAWVSSSAMARELDRRLQTGDVTDLDLLPAALGEEQERFRFGLSPWHQRNGGSWQVPQDIWRDHQQHEALLDQAREIIARSRTTESLVQWRIGLRIPEDGSAASRHGLHSLIAKIHNMVQRYDGRPLVVLHPAQQPFTRTNASPSWQLHPLPLVMTQNRQGIFECLLAIDRSLWSVERQRLTLNMAGLQSANRSNTAQNGLSIYAWMIDDQHRYYHQFLGYMRSDEQQRMVEIDWSEHATWQSIGHDQPWHIGLKRRVRSIGLSAASDRKLPDHNQLTLIAAVDQAGSVQTVRPASYTWLQAAPQQISQWQGIEAHFTLSHQVDNPYDPAQADVVAELRNPLGELKRFPAFWFEPQTITLNNNQEQVTPNGSGHWVLRYAFDAMGTWQFRIKATLNSPDEHHDIVSEWQEITVQAASPKTMLPVQQSTDPRYWQTTDGAWFYPMGITIRSPGDTRQNRLIQQTSATFSSSDREKMGTFAYAEWFKKLHANGGNFVRMWMSPWWTGLEWNRDWDTFQGLGRYNQANAARLDSIVASAKENGIYLQLELLNHGMTSEHVDEQWNPDTKRGNLGSPYNTRNGGIVQKAAEFYSDDEAWRYHQRRLRYTIARWGYAPHIMAWVLSSEMEFTGDFYDEAFNQGSQGHSPTLEAWINKNLNWFAEFDHHQRPVSVHFSHPWRGKEIWANKGLGFSYSNAYTGFQASMGQLGSPRSGLGGALVTYIRSHFPAQTLGRPSLIGEWGGHWQEQNAKKLDAEWRTGLWMQAVLPYSGNTGFWWWLWVDAADTWQQISPVRKFLANDDPRGAELTAVIPRMKRGKTRARLIGSQGPERIYAYAYLYGYDSDNFTMPNSADHHESGSVYFTVTAANQIWICERYNTTTGLVEERSEIISQASTDKDGNPDGSATLELPLNTINPDAAFKLKLQPQPNPTP